MSTTTASMNASITTPMSPTVPSWPVVGTLCVRELVRFFRQKNRVFGALGQPIIFWLLFSEGLRPNGLDYAHFFPGTLVMILLFTAIFATISIIEDRREGFLQGVLVAPVTRWSMVLGKVLGGAAIAVLQGMLFLLLGWATVDAVSPLSVGLFAGLMQGIAMMIVLAIALTGLGFLIAWRMDSTQGFHAIMSVFLFPMWLLSGAFFPADTGGVLGWIVWVNPLTYGVAGLRRCLQLPEVAAEASGNAALVEWASLPPLWVCWIVTLIFAAAMLAACCLVARTRTTGDLR